MFSQLPAGATMAPVQTAGFPTNYPYAYSSPLPSALLRPLQNPLFDTDVLVAAAPQAQIAFFQRAQGQNDALANVKTPAETNLSQSGQLANPLEYSVFSYNFVIQDGTVPPLGANVTLADFNLVMTNSLYTFLYTGNRVYLSVPLDRIPCGVGPEGFAATTVGATTLAMVKNGVGHISNCYRFTIGKSALRIRPTENFQALVAWPRGWVAASFPAANLRLQVFVNGLMWSPL